MSVRATSHDPSGLGWLQRFAGTMKLLRVEVELGTEDAIAMLQAQGGEAVTVSDDTGSTILFSSRVPTVSAVLEELAHVLQHRRRQWIEHDIVDLIELRDLEAKRCLEENAERFGIPDNERVVTQAQIANIEARRGQRRWS